MDPAILRDSKVNFKQCHHLACVSQSKEVYAITWPVSANQKRFLTQTKMGSTISHKISHKSIVRIIIEREYLQHELTGRKTTSRELFLTSVYS